MIQIVRAAPQDAATLSKIAFAAKRHWGYPENWLEEWSAALTLSPAYVETHFVYAARFDASLAGFCAWEMQRDFVVLQHLWVQPTLMHHGVGRALFQHAEQWTQAAGAKRIVVESDPHAEGFYRRMGAINIGHAESRVGGVIRALPLMEKRIG